MKMTSQISDMTSSSNVFDVVLFLLSSLVTDPSFMSISPLVLELWQFSFIKDWPEIQKSKIPPSEICPISGDWPKLGIPNLSWMYLIKSYWMLQYSRVTAFTVSPELLKETQQEGGGSGWWNYPPPPPRLGLSRNIRDCLQIFLLSLIWILVYLLNSVFTEITRKPMAFW